MIQRTECRRGFQGADRQYVGLEGKYTVHQDLDNSVSRYPNKAFYMYLGVAKWGLGRLFFDLIILLKKDFVEEEVQCGTRVNESLTGLWFSNLR